MRHEQWGPSLARVSAPRPARALPHRLYLRRLAIWTVVLGFRACGCSGASGAATSRCRGHFCLFGAGRLGVHGRQPAWGRISCICVCWGWCGIRGCIANWGCIPGLWSGRWGRVNGIGFDQVRPITGVVRSGRYRHSELWPSYPTVLFWHLRRFGLGPHDLSGRCVRVRCVGLDIQRWVQAVLGSCAWLSVELGLRVLAF